MPGTAELEATELEVLEPEIAEPETTEPETSEPTQANSRELDFARGLVAEAISAPDVYLDIITLACAVTHRINDLYSAPRILALGERGCGKSSLLTLASYLAAGTTSPTGITAMTAPSYVASYRANENWTPLLDEVNHLFGEMGVNGKQSQLRTYLNQGYNRSTGFAQHVESKVSVRIPIFGVVFMAGQGRACPDDLRDRSIILPMETAPPGRETSDFSDEQTRAKFGYGGLSLESWVNGLEPLSIASVRKLNLHPKLVKRNMEVWGGLFAVALQAGDVWLKRCLLAFERIECGQKAIIHAPETQLLLDYAAFAELPVIPAESDLDEEALADLDATETEGVASGEFAAYVMSQAHGAFTWMKPGQFRQFAVRQLGPTAPFYDRTKGTMVRGWSGVVNQMNLDRAHRELERLAADNPKEATSPADVWSTDF